MTDIDAPPALELNSDSDSDDSDGDELSGDDGDPTTCLFCEHVSAGVPAAMEHVQHAHGVSFAQLKARFQMDQYAFMKLINCIRADGVAAEKLQHAQLSFWADDKYLKPAEYEPWLTYDYDELQPVAAAAASKSTDANGTDNGALVASLQQKIKEQTLLLEQASEDMARMRESFQNLVEKTDTTTNGAARPRQSLRTDESYFSGYAHFGIHHEMLSDVVRTSSYRDALLRNADFVRGKTVLDVGCGTSILSIFAAQAGAKTVVGIDNSDIVYDAMDIVKTNNIPNVTIVKGRVEEATALGEQKFDIIISEWMGYFLLFEGMLDSVIYARDHYLAPGGVLLPNRCTMSIVGYGSDALFDSHVTFWSDVYGLNMSNMRKQVLHEPLVDIVDAQHVLTAAATVADLNLATVGLDYSNFTHAFDLKCTTAGKLTAFVGYFDTYFDLPQPVMFGTGPADKPTHWKQVVFFLERAHALGVGDVVSGTLCCQRSGENARSLDITIDAFGQQYKYYLD